MVPVKEVKGRREVGEGRRGDRTEADAENNKKLTQTYFGNIKLGYEEWYAPRLCHMHSLFEILHRALTHIQH